MSEDDGISWCKCDYTNQCYGGSKYLGVKCKLNPDEAPRFLPPRMYIVDGDKDDD